ncbi:hypothetical protein GO986_04100 [Deinococcus sp. HMF7620]|uniref:Uncharacterized protein n=1 Tax=Deinococcus arboris TaxID=2682977 RepID=A0A7C9LPG7_9DEIO|nr:hypothetical protein [Deinococcus arboris]MVN85941.1 hypothetical protein [Deinococcus arboris]
MTYQVLAQGQETRVAFPSSPDWLDATQPHEWLLVPHAKEEGIHLIAAEVEASCTQTLLPFLNQVSAPEGLLAFMVDINQPLKLLIAGPWPSGPFRRAAAVLEALLSPDELAPALAQLSAAELAFRTRWEARQNAVQPS